MMGVVAVVFAVAIIRLITALGRLSREIEALRSRVTSLERRET